MKRIISKQTFLIAALILLSHIIISSFSYIYVNRGVLFDDSMSRGTTSIYMKINADFNLEEIKKAVHEVTQHKYSNITVTETSSREVLIQTDFTENNKIEDIVLKLQQKYGKNITIIAQDSGRINNPSEYRRKLLFLFFIACSVLIISTSLFIVCFKSLNYKKD